MGIDKDPEGREGWAVVQIGNADAKGDRGANVNSVEGERERDR